MFKTKVKIFNLLLPFYKFSAIRPGLTVNVQHSKVK